MYRVLLTDNIATQAVEVFEGYEGIEATSVGTLDREELMAILPDYHALIVRSPTKVTREIIEAGTNLKFIGRAGVGLDNIDLDSATGQGITVMNAPGGNTISTAEHTVAMILALARRIPEGDRSVRAGRWERSALKGVEVAEKTLGVIGLGRIGREVARRMLAFDMAVVGTDPYVGRESAAGFGVEWVEPAQLFGRSDFITVHVPIGSDTRGLIGTAEFGKMKDGVFLVNCARGGVVDEAAALAALRSGKVAGIAFDVFSEEPPGAHPLLTHDRSVFTPHLGAATGEAQVRVAVDIARSVADALSGKEARNAVNRPSG